ncbi:hypothetical protein GGS23DRAFT_437377 [Durotheca rogersii]|uniref:uncharacterized protein n=1 Tax=Durotheca rogersii TaxID=419775 RepID=UPI002220BCA7|nr:uncharacterized protein GGS23DRAFT_437377 [Durotheca rogersii]KAI5865666.1 hypothetical protein GGS23DRAFT_437377 [Durotheca rogersii]
MTKPAAIATLFSGFSLLSACKFSQSVDRQYGSQAFHHRLFVCFIAVVGLGLGQSKPTRARHIHRQTTYRRVRLGR